MAKIASKKIKHLFSFPKSAFNLFIFENYEDINHLNSFALQFYQYIPRPVASDVKNFNCKYN